MSTTTRHRWLVLLACLPLLGACDKAKVDSTRLSNKGMKALEANDVPAAYKFFSDAVEIYDDNANAHYGLGLVLKERGQLARARHHLLKATKLKESFVEGLYHLGDIALKQGRLDEAEANLRRVLEGDAEHAHAYYLLGRIHEKRGQLKDANVAFRRAVTLDPYKPAFFLALARLYFRVGAEKEALAVLTEGIRLCQPDVLETTHELAVLFNELGQAMYKAGHYGKAVDSFKSALKYSNELIEVPFNLGQAYASQGEYKLAVQYFMQYVQIGPRDGETVRLAQRIAAHLRERIAKQKAAAEGKTDKGG